MEIDEGKVRVLKVNDLELGTVFRSGGNVYFRVYGELEAVDLATGQHKHIEGDVYPCPDAVLSLRVAAPYEKDAENRICDACNLVKDCVYQEDPYQKEVDNVVELRWLCEDCHQSLCQDI